MNKKEIKELKDFINNLGDQNNDDYNADKISHALIKAGYRPAAEVRAETAKEFAEELLGKIDNGIKDIKKHPYDSREETELFIRALECVRMDTENIVASFGKEGKE